MATIFFAQKGFEWSEFFSCEGKGTDKNFFFAPDLFTWSKTFSAGLSSLRPNRTVCLFHVLQKKLEHYLFFSWFLLSAYGSCCASQGWPLILKTKQDEKNQRKWNFKCKPWVPLLFPSSPRVDGSSSSHWCIDFRDLRKCVGQLCKGKQAIVVVTDQFIGGAARSSSQFTYPYWNICKHQHWY